MFRADLTTIEVGQVALQRGRENLPRLSSSGMPSGKVGLLGWLDTSELPVVRGVKMQRGDWMYLGSGMQSHHRSPGAIEFVALTLDTSNLTRAAIELIGSEVTILPGTVLRPPAHFSAWMLSVVEAVIRATDITPSPLAAEALEYALLRLLILCLTQGEPRRDDIPHIRRSILVKRFEEAVEANLDRDLPMPELCRLIGVSGRSLRTLCQEQLGVSPHRFLALRRLHLARRVLLRSDHHQTTVTNVATSHGVWELGRFAASYRSLFGETPSATLRRAPE